MGVAQINQSPKRQGRAMPHKAAKPYSPNLSLVAARLRRVLGVSALVSLPNCYTENAQRIQDKVMSSVWLRLSRAVSSAVESHDFSQLLRLGEDEKLLSARVSLHN